MPTELTEKDVKLWQNRVELGRRFQDEFGNSGGRWDKNRNAMAGDFNSEQELGSEAVDVNMVRSTIKSVLPPLWLSEPFIAVKATQPTFKGADNVRMAEVTEVEVNYWLSELEVRHQIRKVVHDAEGTNVGYLYISHAKEDDPSVHTIRKGRPFVRRHRTEHVVVPAGYDDLDSAPWVDLIFVKPIRDVVEKYGEDVTEGIIETRKLKSPEGMDNSSDFSEYMDSDDVKLVEIHNVWDKATKKVYIFAEGHDVFLEDPAAWPYEPEGFPLVRYSPEYVSDQYYGTPPINFYMQQNKELNATRTAMAKRRNRTKATVFVDSGLMDQIGDKWKQSDDGELIAVDLDDGADIRSKIYLDPGLPLDQGDFAYDGILKTDIREQSGLGAERRGGGDPNIGSATASANVEKGIQVREADRGDGVKGLYLGVAKRVWMILKQFPNVKRTRLIAGPLAGSFAQIEYTLKELKGEFNFDMDFGAMLADNPQARANRALLNYNMLRADPLVNANQLVLDVLATQNTPNPAAYLLKLRSTDEEHQIMGQGLPVEADERDQHEVHLQAHDALSDQIDQQLQQMPPDAPQRGQMAEVQQMILAHMDHHIKLVEKITGGAGGGAGKPIAENQLRQQVKGEAGSETAAELGGQPLTRSPDQLIQ